MDSKLGVDHYFISSAVNADKRIFKIEDYRANRIAAEDALKKIHPPGSSLELFKYTMGLSGMRYVGDLIDATPAQRREFLIANPESCCVVSYDRSFGLLGWEGHVIAEYDDKGIITDIKVVYTSGGL